MHGTTTAVERLTPTMVRLVLGGDGLADFAAVEFTDAYVNVAIPRSGAYEAPFDLDAIRERLPEDEWPARRRYTVRHWDAAERSLTIDFVVHGDVGVAGAWAARARVGDSLQFTGPSGSYRPDPGAAWHLMVGDESALPAIAASLAAVPAGVPVVVRLLCDGAGFELGLETEGDLDLQWLHRTAGPDDVDRLADSVRDLRFAAGRVHAFVHGEAEEIRRVRRHLLGERNVAKADTSISPYWRRTMTDEAWRQVKSAWTAEVEREVPEAAGR